jgi:hypothetical protein
VECTPSATATSTGSGVAPDRVYATQATDAAALTAALNGEFGAVPTAGAKDCTSAETYPWTFRGGTTAVGDVYCGYFPDIAVSAYDWSYADEAVVLEALTNGRVGGGLKTWWDSLSTEQITLR